MNFVFSHQRNRDSKLFTSVILAKVRENPASLKFALLLMNFTESQQVPLCLAGRFSVCFMSRFLAGPSRTHTGIRQAFLLSGETSCVECNPVRGHSVPAQIFIQFLSLFCRKFFRPAATSCHHISFPEWKFNSLFRDFCFFKSEDY